jgi:nucleoside-diphosphate-sugar epimerase
MDATIKPATVLVTGAGGFIGRRMLKVLRGRRTRTIGLDHVGPESTSGPLAGRPADDWIIADITANAPVVLPEGIDTVIHLAGKAHALADIAQDEADYFRINTDGTRHMLEAAQRAGARAFVLFSSVKAAGDKPATANAGPADESWDAEPDTPYGRSKREAEKLVLGGGYVPHPVVLRPCLVYGPTPKGNLEKMIDAVTRGRFPPLPEVGNKRSMVHIDDVIAAALLAAENPAAAGQTYIVADNEPFSTRQLFEWICAAVGHSVPRWTMPLRALRLLGRMGDGIGRVHGRRFIFDSNALEKLIGSAWYSSAKLQRELGWRPEHTLRESLQEIVGFHRLRD